MSTKAPDLVEVHRSPAGIPGATAHESALYSHPPFGVLSCFTYSWNFPLLSCSCYVLFVESKRPSDPPQPKSTGSQLAIQPHSWTLSISSCYFAYFLSWASSICSSQSTMSSSTLSRFVASEIRIISGWSEVTIGWGNNSHLFSPNLSSGELLQL